MLYIYLLISFLIGLIVSRTILSQLFGKWSFLGGAVILPSLFCGLSATLLLRISQNDIGQTIYISSVFISFGAVCLWGIGLYDSIKRCSVFFNVCLKLLAASIFPLASLRINHLHGLLGVYNLPLWQSYLLTIVLTFFVVEAISTLTDSKNKLCGLSILLLLGIFGISFFEKECYTYTFIAFSLLGSLLPLLYYKYFGDKCIGTNIRIGSSGTWILGFSTSYLLLKHLTDSPSIKPLDTDTIVTVCSLVILVFMFLLPLLLELFSKQADETEEKCSPDESHSQYHGKEGMVSVIMATYNSKRFVSESIQSVLNQNYTNLELIITDDASSDGTPELLKEWKKKDPRVHIILNKENGGAGKSRNCSIKAAQGQYIAFCDSDDRWTEDKLEHQIKFMKHFGIALCFCPYYTCDAHNHYLGYVSAPRRVNLFEMMCDNKIGFLTAIYDTVQLGKHFMPAQRKRQDHALLLTLMRQCKYAYSVPEPLAHYRLHEGNMSGGKFGLLKYNAKTYNAVFGWNMAFCWIFLFTFFLPTYFKKKITNILVNIFRTQLG